MNRCRQIAHEQPKLRTSRNIFEEQCDDNQSTNHAVGRSCYWEFHFPAPGSDPGNRRSGSEAGSQGIGQGRTRERGLRPGKNYVVEFWATWCGPCKTSIPHLSDIQKRTPRVTFIGVSISEPDQAKVKPFVDEMGG